MNTFADFSAATERAIALHRAGQSEAALELAEQAQRAAAHISVPVSVEAGEAFNWLGMTFSETGYNRSAREAYERALAIAEAVQPQSMVLLENVLNNLGQVEAALENPEQAGRLLERAVELRSARVPDSLDLALALDNLAGVHAGTGQLDRAETMHKQALTIFARVNGPFDTHVAVALGNLSRIYLRRGDLERAEAYRARALDIHLRAFGWSHPPTLLDLRCLIEVVFARHEYQRGDQLLNVLLSVGGDVAERSHRFLAEMLNDLAEWAFGDHRLDVAERLSTRALALLEQLEGEHAPDTLEAAQLLGSIQRGANDLTSAERNYRRALEGFNRLDDIERAAAVTIELAKVYRERGAHQVAESLLRTAIERLRQSAKTAPGSVASALGNLGQVYYAAGQYEQAEQSYAAALADIGAADHPERPWLLHSQALLRYHLGDYARARPLFEAARAIWVADEGPEHPFVATTSANLALSLWAEGAFDDAVVAFSEAATLRERALRRQLAVGSERKRLAAARSAIPDLHRAVSFHFAVAPAVPTSARLAALLTLQRKSRVLDALGHTLTTIRNELGENDRALLNRLFALRSEIAAIAAPTPVTRKKTPGQQQLTRLRDEEETLEAQLSHRAAMHDPALDEVTIEAVQSALAPGGVLIEFLRASPFDPVRTAEWAAFGIEHYYALVLRPAAEPRWFDLGTAAEIDEQVNDLRRVLRSRSSPIESIRELCSRLYRLLIEPLESMLDDARRIVIAPDGLLTLLPFGPLLDASGRRLSQRAPVSYVNSGRELQFMHDAASESNDVVVVAAPNFDFDPSQSGSSPTAGFAPLPGAEQEAETIAQLLEGVTVITGAAATTEAVRSVHRPAALHIATHGFLSAMDEPRSVTSLDLLPVGEPMLLQQTVSEAQPNPMYFSGIALAGANHRAADQQTGILTAQEMAGLDLRGTQLVVLSACETGLGTITNGSEFAGLRRALAIAGADAQITSLWRVSDAATCALMRHFYALLAAGCGRADALELSRLKVEQDPEHPEWQHPFYWSGFILSGAWTPVNASMAARTAAAESVSAPSQHERAIDAD